MHVTTRGPESGPPVLHAAPGFDFGADEEALLDTMLSTAVGEDQYPGDGTASASWPGVGPGTRGVLNTMSPRWFDLSGVVDVPVKPPITRIRGDQDAIVSDGSFFDLAQLGKLGLVPGWRLLLMRPGARCGTVVRVDPTDSTGLVSLVSTLAVVIGVVGVLVPMVPGLLLCWAGVMVWAVFGGAGAIGWAVGAAATVVLALGFAAKYLVPGRNLKRAGVSNLTLLLGGVCGIVGFFLIPVVGLIIGFVLGIFLVELARQQDGSRAWQSTKHALKAAGVSMLIELATALIIAAIWIVGLLAA
jgi:uncharacterized protein YqgC (DUF456 family)